MKTSNKTTLAIILSLVSFWICKRIQPKEIKNEIVVGEIHIEKEPCTNAVHELLGKGIDSSKVCDCLIPSFYNLIKNDSSLVQKLRDSNSFFKLEGTMNDSFALRFEKCVKENILDSDYKMKFTPQFALVFKSKLKQELNLQKNIYNVNIDSACNCIVDKLNGNITISEYFSGDYSDIPRIKQLIINCTAISSN